jgi:hypothetical protein
LKSHIVRENMDDNSKSEQGLFDPGRQSDRPAFCRAQGGRAGRMKKP